jgi:hypothetical protein
MSFTYQTLLPAADASADGERLWEFFPRQTGNAVFLIA